LYKVSKEKQLKFQDYTVPNRNITHKSNTGLLLENRKRTELKFQMLTEEKHDEINDRLEHSPQKSLRCLVQEITFQKHLHECYI
jgi:hypothetical protein